MRLPVSLVCAVAFVALAATCRAAECHGKPDPDAQPNLNPIFTEPPRFVRSVPNGQLYVVGPTNLSIVHLWGSPYEKGYAHGQLMKDKATGMMNATWQYLENEAISGVNSTGHSLGLPQDIIDAIADYGLETLLDLTYLATKDFTGEYFDEEMHGLADGAGVDYLTIRRIHMIGELTKGSCSMFGAWGNATASMGGKLLQLRALDWAMDGPFKNYPQLTVYHATGNATFGDSSFINIGWSGWIGSITGMSINQVAICEIGVAFPDATFGKESRVGIPFTYILRDILQFDKTLQDGMNRIATANRTCDLILGVGDGKPGGGFRGVEYSHSVANFFTDTNLEPTATWHPRLNNVVYFGMDWLCPSYNSILARQLSMLHGNITAANTIRYITPIVQTGDLHIAIYDLADMLLYVSVARSEGQTGPANAYDRQFVQLDMKAVFAQQMPQSNPSLLPSLTPSATNTV